MHVTPMHNIVLIISMQKLHGVLLMCRRKVALQDWCKIDQDQGRMFIRCKDRENSLHDTLLKFCSLFDTCENFLPYMASRQIFFPYMTLQCILFINGVKERCEKTFLPIVHNVTKKTVQYYFMFSSRRLQVLSGMIFPPFLYTRPLRFSCQTLTFNFG